jgi:two-component system, cell cycle sensor histidine kinase and response regulator CckA
MKPLRILFVEDRPFDADLVGLELAKEEFDFILTRVDTPGQFRKSLQEASPDIVLSDYNLPGFDAFEALAILKEVCPHVPFILVTGTQSEQVAVECMKRGAADYILKSSLRRLPGAVRNVLDRARAERDKLKAIEALQASERQYRLIAENTRDLIAVLDTNGYFIYASPSHEHVFRRNAATLHGKSLFEFLHAEDRDGVFNTFQQALLDKHEVTLEFRVADAGGKWHTLEASVNWVRDAVGNPAKGIVVSREVTHSRYLEQQVRQSQRMEAIGRLAGGIAHDFNNLLNVILGYTDLMIEHLQSGPHDADSVRYLEAIAGAGTRAASVTRQLLAFSRRQVMELSVIDLNLAVRGLVQMLKNLIGENVTVDTRLAPGLGSVRADPAQLEQVLMNLILNAKDAMPQGGSLSIETSNIQIDSVFASVLQSPPGPYVLLRVTDTGVGMDEETVSRVFEPFFTTKESGKGTGLGLATVYGIVKQSEGSILVRSEPGQGTTFEIFLPEAKRTEAAPPIVSSSDQQVRGNETVLVVEDEALVRELALEILNRNGYNVVCAPGVQEGLELCRSIETLHLVLTDVVLSKGNGWQMANAIAQIHEETKVIFMSGYSHDVLATQNGFPASAAVLQKPFAASELLQKIRTVLDSDAYLPWARTAKTEPIRI